MSEIENKELTPEKESGLNFEQMVADDLKNEKKSFPRPSAACSAGCSICC